MQALPHTAHVRMLWRVGSGWTVALLTTALVGAAASVVSMLAIGKLIGALYSVLTADAASPAVSGSGWRLRAA